MIDKCICGCRTSGTDRQHGISVLICERCHLTRQNLEAVKKEEYKQFTDKYIGELYTHSYKEDERVAKLRLKNSYKLKEGSKLLDFGCGHGAFVNECRKKGVVAYGCDISDECSTEYRYRGRIEDIHFPTDNFETVTAHDVLEHIPDPLTALKEIFRIVKEGGDFYIDMPDFYCNVGVKHWKPMEHIWFFSIEEMIQLVESVGFHHMKSFAPVEGKWTMRFDKPTQERCSIMVPPGIGDAFWSLIKIKSFCEKNNLGIPDVFISSNGRRDRSYEFVKMFPFVNSAGYSQQSHKDPIFKEAYTQDGRTIFDDVKELGVDYFIAYNGITRYGRSIDEVDTEFTTDWFPDMFESLEQRAYGINFHQRHGNYIVAYFVDHGMYKHWLKEFDIFKIAEVLWHIYKETGCKIVLLGAGWDKGGINDALTSEDFTSDHIVDLTGKTTLEEAFAVLKLSDGCIGYPSGLTIMSTVFRKPTYLLWNNYFCDEFFWTACPPQARGFWYDTINTEDATPCEVIDDFLYLTKYREKAPPRIMGNTSYSPKQMKEMETMENRKEGNIKCSK